MKSPVMRSRAMLWCRKEVLPLLIVALVIFSVRSSLADWNDVPTGSMKPTIVEGDRVYVNKLAYDLKVPFTTRHLAEWGNPNRGDIVVFYSPYDEQRLVKRVIGMPGDTLELRNDVLYLNGQKVQYDPIGEPASQLPPLEQPSQVFAREALPGHPHKVAAIPAIPARRDFGPFTVPEGQYFMMGDNRDNSFDSRYYGCVERRRILGRATTVVLSIDRQHHWLPRWHRFFSSLDS